MSDPVAELLTPGTVFTHASCLEVNPETGEAVMPHRLQRFVVVDTTGTVKPLPASDPREPTYALSGGMVYR